MAGKWEESNGFRGGFGVGPLESNATFTGE